MSLFSVSFQLLSESFPLWVLFVKNLYKTPSFYREIFQDNVLSAVAFGDSIRNAPSVFETKQYCFIHKGCPLVPSPSPLSFFLPPSKEQLYSAVIKYLIKHETSVPMFNSPSQASPCRAPSPAPVCPPLQPQLFIYQGWPAQQCMEIAFN